MQDIYPDVVTPDRLVNEILRGLPCEAALASKAKHLASCNKKSCPSKSTSSSGIGDDLEGTGEDEDIVMSKNASVSSSRAMSIEEADAEDSDVGTNLAQQGYNEVVILDCQNPNEFHDCHIRGAINVAFPAILIRRIAAGKIDLFERSKELKAKISNAKIIFVVYDSYSGCGSTPMDSSSSISAPGDTANSGTLGGGGNQPTVPGLETGNAELSDLVTLVSKKLAQNGCRVATLKGGLAAFKELYPEWIVTTAEAKNTCSSSNSASSEENTLEPGEVPLLGLGSLASLRIQDDPDTCDSSIGLDLDDQAFPVEIIPNLYLGNAAISGELSILERNNIKHILNVTPDLPNVFENGNIRYLQIPISDHWTQSMLHYFPAAIQFIAHQSPRCLYLQQHFESYQDSMLFVVYDVSTQENEGEHELPLESAEITLPEGFRKARQDCRKL
ncbi:Dual specificity protein phosphatase Mpk3 [Orchesella cincta]|uniref:protein-tyrosine-phosphatase n=1 Tax=Orchesella cincta TaxID=48709 RepID=A0A1D2MMT3_ORCCI|nr:Dual specificity protein phosphatase Mpk3 [Orchesella cincta]